jgi:O-antigen/teichoic acid export membrane protein
MSKTPTKVSNIAKNTSYFTLALILQKVISFAYFTLLARNLLPEDLGKYYLAISITSIFSIIIDLGFSNVIVREVAKKEYEPEKLLSNILILKIPLSALAFLVVYLLANIMGYPEITRTLIYISSISMILDSFTLSFYAVIRGFHNLKYESIGSVSFQLIVLLLGFIFLRQGRSLNYLMIVMALASAFNFLYAFWLNIFKFKIKINTGFDKTLIRNIIFITAPFTAYAVLQRLYMYLDSVLISVLSGDSEVGIYQISFKIIYALQFLPMAFVASLYPAFASYWKETKNSSLDQRVNNTEVAGDASVTKNLPLDVCKCHARGVSETSLAKNSPLERGVREADGVCGTSAIENSQGPSQLAITFERAMNYLIIISLPISIGIIALADKIMLIFKPEYADGIVPLKIIMLALPFIFLNFPIGSLLNACDRQIKNTYSMLIVVIFSVALNLVLIPRFFALGASITVLVSNALALIIGIFFIHGLINYRPKKIYSVLAKALFSAIIMSLLVIWLKNYLHIILVIPISACLYFVLLLITNAFNKEDIKSITQSFLRRKG